MMAWVFYFEIIGYLVLLPPICLFGFVGNILTLIVLTRGNVINAVAYTYLTALAILDLLSLLFILPISLTRCPICSFHSYYVAQLFEVYLYISVGDIFLKASIWTTTLFTLERTVTICFSKSFIPTERRTIVICIVAIVLCSAFENIPSFFTYSISDQNEVVLSSFSSHSAFFDFYRWFDALFVGVFPFLILLVFNVLLIRALYQQRHRVALRTFLQNSRSRRLLEESRVLHTVVGVIVLFLLTTFPSLLIQALWDKISMTSDSFKVIRLTTALLVATNASGNFILYCFLNRRFFQAFKRLLCHNRTAIVPMGGSSTRQCRPFCFACNIRLPRFRAKLHRGHKTQPLEENVQQSSGDDRNNINCVFCCCYCICSSKKCSYSTEIVTVDTKFRDPPSSRPLRNTTRMSVIEDERELPLYTVSLTSPSS